MTDRLTATGLTIPTYAEIFDGIKTDLQAGVDPSINLESDSPFGEQLRIIALEIRHAYEYIATLYAALDPDAANGALLDNLAAITGTTRLAQTFSTVATTCNLDIGFVAAAGEMRAHVVNTDRVFTNSDDVGPIGSTGDYTVPFIAVNPGPVPAPAGTLTSIDTVLAGWNSITNPLDATLGIDTETDTELRNRRELELAQSGGSTIPAIAAAIKALAGVLDCVVYENVTSAILDTLPPHSIEIVVDDNNGATPNDDIAAAMYSTVPAGIERVGSVSGIVEENGETIFTGLFTRPDLIEIYFAVELAAGSTASLLDVQNAVLTRAAALFRIGDDVDAVMVIGAVTALPGVTGIVDWGVGLTSLPTAKINIPIGTRERASFAAARIAFYP